MEKTVAELTAQYKAARDENSMKFAAAGYLRAAAFFQKIIETDFTDLVGEGDTDEDKAKDIAEKRNRRLKFDRSWTCRGTPVTIQKATSHDTSDLGSPTVSAVSESLMAASIPVSIPLQLVSRGMRSMEFGVRFFAETAPAVGVPVGESKAIPTTRSRREVHVLERRKFGAIAIVTNELVQCGSAAPLKAIVDSLARAVAIAENEGFVGPLIEGSVFFGNGFTGSGSTIAAIDSDLRRLLDSRLDDGAESKAVWVMPARVATYLSTLRGSAGVSAYPGMATTGGMLLGIDVLTSGAMEINSDSPVQSAVGICDPMRIYYNAGVSTTTISKSANLELSDASDLPGNPTGATDVPTAATAVPTSVFQEDCSAIKVLRTSGWFSGESGGYFTIDV